MDMAQLTLCVPSHPRNTSARVLHAFARVLLASFLAVCANSAMAQTNLVTNGSFAVTGGSTSFQFGTAYSSSESLANWSTSGYNFVYLPSSTTAVGNAGNVSMYSKTTTPSDTFNNASPTGGNFVAADSDYQTAAISQTINGLTQGSTYAVSFAWAGTQQLGWTGASTEQWQVSLGSSTQTTTQINVASANFAGWFTPTLNFVATSSSELLSFLAIGTVTGVPSFALLSNVSVTKVPEPASAALLITAVAGLIGASRLRRQPAVAITCGG